MKIDAFRRVVEMLSCWSRRDIEDGDAAKRTLGGGG